MCGLFVRRIRFVQRLCALGLDQHTGQRGVADDFLSRGLDHRPQYRLLWRRAEPHEKNVSQKQSRESKVDPRIECWILAVAKYCHGPDQPGKLFRGIPGTTFLQRQSPWGAAAKMKAPFGRVIPYAAFFFSGRGVCSFDFFRSRGSVSMTVLSCFIAVTMMRLSFTSTTKYMGWS